METPLNLVDDHDLLINKGDAHVISYSETPERFGLIITCPGCGETSASKDQKHTYNKETQSYTPSIVHNVKLGGCGWHGWLTNGIFKKC